MQHADYFYRYQDAEATYPSISRLAYIAKATPELTKLSHALG